MNENNTRLMDLVADIDGMRQKMQGVVSEMDPTLVICPGWTIKDVIGHITAWEIVIHKAIQSFSTGGPPYFLAEQDFDIFNQRAVEFRAAWSLEKVIKEWQDVRAALRATLRDLDPGRLEEDLVLPWGSERTLAELIEIIGEHEGEHLEAVLKVTS